MRRLRRLVNRPVGEVGEKPEFTTPDGRRIVRSHKLIVHDRFAQVGRVELLFDVTYPDGRRERLTHEFPLRYLFRFELEHLLARAGFRVEQIDADYDRSPYGSRYPGELLVVARKESGERRQGSPRHPKLMVLRNARRTRGFVMVLKREKPV